jgi:hypothetical protein
MRWLIAGLFFALAVALTIATAAIRAQNIAERREIQRVYDEVQDRDKDLIRLGYEGLEAASPERLAQLHREWLQNEVLRQQERVQ